MGKLRRINTYIQGKHFLTNTITADDNRISIDDFLDFVDYSYYPCYRFRLFYCELMSNSFQTGKSNQNVEVVFDQLLGTFQLPQNIDPLLFDTWYNREVRALEAEELEDNPLPETPTGRGLGRVFAVHVGVVAMITTICIGLLNGTPNSDILNNVCWVLIMFTSLGYLAGLVADYAVKESVETIIREVIQRSDDAGRTEANVTTEGVVSG
jgi:hypothetical protein